MKEQLQAIEQAALAALDTATATAEVEALRVQVLGKKGELTAVLRSMGNLPAQERPVMGQLVNDMRQTIEARMAERLQVLSASEQTARLAAEAIDVTIPAPPAGLGAVHPMYQGLNEILDIFVGLGFSVADGPEVEWDYYNFQALNTPLDHPARDSHDTFYINPQMLLRTHTSPVQVRVMEQGKLPIRIVCPGKAYRSDAVDATHSPMFHQVEGLVIDKGISMANLKGTLDAFAKGLYGGDTTTRFRPHHFPFTEPSAEVDIRCPFCQGKGCKVCKQTGWVELLGCGMVHPNVLRMSDIDPDEYSGFAFGMGLERVVMMKYDINDIRLLYENDVRFLSQFA